MNVRFMDTKPFYSASEFGLNDLCVQRKCHCALLYMYVKEETCYNTLSMVVNKFAPCSNKPVQTTLHDMDNVNDWSIYDNIHLPFIIMGVNILSTLSVWLN